MPLPTITPAYFSHSVFDVTGVSDGANFTGSLTSPNGGPALAAVTSAPAGHCVYRATGIDGWPALEFNSTGGLFGGNATLQSYVNNTASGSADKPWTMAWRATVNVINATNHTLCLSSSSNANPFVTCGPQYTNPTSSWQTRRRDDNQAPSTGGGGVLVSGSSTGTHSFVAVFDGTNISLYVDGTQVGSASAASTANAFTITQMCWAVLFRQTNGTPIGSPGNCLISKSLIADGAVNSTDRGAIETWLAEAPPIVLSGANANVATASGILWDGTLSGVSAGIGGSVGALGRAASFALLGALASIATAAGSVSGISPTAIYVIGNGSSTINGWVDTNYKGWLRRFTDDINTVRPGSLCDVFGGAGRTYGNLAPDGYVWPDATRAAMAEFQIEGDRNVTECLKRKPDLFISASQGDISSAVNAAGSSITTVAHVQAFVNNEVIPVLRAIRAAVVATGAAWCVITDTPQVMSGSPTSAEILISEGKKYFRDQIIATFATEEVINTYDVLTDGTSSGTLGYGELAVAYQSGNASHPNAAGHQALADAARTVHIIHGRIGHKFSPWTGLTPSQRRLMYSPVLGYEDDGAGNVTALYNHGTNDYQTSGGGAGYRYDARVPAGSNSPGLVTINGRPAVQIDGSNSESLQYADGTVGSTTPISTLTTDPVSFTEWIAFRLPSSAPASQKLVSFGNGSSDSHFDLTFTDGSNGITSGRRNSGAGSGDQIGPSAYVPGTIVWLWKEYNGATDSGSLKVSSGSLATGTQDDAPTFNRLTFGATGRTTIVHNSIALDLVAFAAVAGTRATIGSAGVASIDAWFENLTSIGASASIATAAGLFAIGNATPLLGFNTGISGSAGTFTVSESIAVSGANSGVATTAGQLSPGEAVAISGANASIATAAGSLATLASSGDLPGVLASIATGVSALTAADAVAVSGAGAAISTASGALDNARATSVAGTGASVATSAGALGRQFNVTVSGANASLVGQSGTLDIPGGPLAGIHAGIATNAGSIGPNATFALSGAGASLATSTGSLGNALALSLTGGGAFIAVAAGQLGGEATVTGQGAAIATQAGLLGLGWTVPVAGAGASISGAVGEFGSNTALLGSVASLATAVGSFETSGDQSLGGQYAAILGSTGSFQTLVALTGADAFIGVTEGDLNPFVDSTMLPARGFTAFVRSLGRPVIPR